MAFLANLTALRQEYHIREWDQLGQAVVFKSTIKGYHDFHLRPLVGTKFLMTLVREPDNPRDCDAVLVVAPPLADVDVDLHNKMTKESSPTQTVRDVAGHNIGRVPAKFCKIVSKGLEKGHIVKGVAIHTGGFTHGGSVMGGGPQLNCCFMIVIRNDKFESISQQLVGKVGEMYRL